MKKKDASYNQNPVRDDFEIYRLGKWFPAKSNLKRNFMDFKLSVYLSLIELVLSASFIYLIYRPLSIQKSDLIFYAASSLKYFLEIFIVFGMVLKVEKRHFGSIGLRNFKKETSLFWKEILWTAFFASTVIVGTIILLSQKSSATFSPVKIVIHGVYLLLCVSLGEEIVWRGFIFSRFCLSIGKFIAFIFLLLLMILWHLPYHLYVSSHSGTSIFSLIFFSSVSGTAAMVLLVLLSEKLIGRWNIYFAIFLHWFFDFSAFLSNPQFIQ
jgi:membrane protease YdiL (CAAX protease family)